MYYYEEPTPAYYKRIVKRNKHSRNLYDVDNDFDWKDYYDYKNGHQFTFYYFPNFTEEQLITELYNNYYETVLMCYKNSDIHFYTILGRNYLKDCKFTELYVTHDLFRGYDVTSLVEDEMNWVEGFKPQLLREVTVETELMNQRLDIKAFTNLIEFFNTTGEYGDPILALIKKNDTFILVV